MLAVCTSCVVCLLLDQIEIVKTRDLCICGDRSVRIVEVDSFSFSE